MDKDRQIITQVAAKIAADLVDKNANTNEKLGEFATLFTNIKDMIFDVITADADNAQIFELAKQTFNATTVGAGDTVNTPDALQIVGTQHGEIPEWLIKACKRDGITRVYDNRDGLSINPKRPWFKAVDVDKAYWAPKTRTR